MLQITPPLPPPTTRSSAWPKAYQPCPIQYKIPPEFCDDSLDPVSCTAPDAEASDLKISKTVSNRMTVARVIRINVGLPLSLLLPGLFLVRLP